MRATILSCIHYHSSATLSTRSFLKAHFTNHSRSITTFADESDFIAIKSKVGQEWLIKDICAAKRISWPITSKVVLLKQ
jgi:hypothetical protein